MHFYRPDIRKQNTNITHGFPHMVFAGQRLWKTPVPKIPEGRGAFAPSAKRRRK